MGLKYFICPDQVKISVDRCLSQCRMKDRCLTKSTLIHLSKERKLDQPSVTELLNGPRLEYLKKTQDYAIDPNESAFAFLGTKAHDALQLADHIQGMNEVRIRDEITTGQFDNLEYENGLWHLTDYKTYGSYKVKLFLESGIEELELQLNMLRILIEQAKLKVDGKEVLRVDKMWVQIIVRDGGLYIAKKNGIHFKMRRLQVTRLQDMAVINYFQSKKQELNEGLRLNKIPRLCNAKEAWGGKRCSGYCPVSEYCIANGDNTYVKK